MGEGEYGRRGRNGGTESKGGALESYRQRKTEGKKMLNT